MFVSQTSSERDDVSICSDDHEPELPLQLELSSGPAMRLQQSEVAVEEPEQPHVAQPEQAGGVGGSENNVDNDEDDDDNDDDDDYDKSRAADALKTSTAIQESFVRTLDFMKAFFETESEKGKEEWRKFTLKLNLSELIEDLRLELTNELGIPECSTSSEIIECMNDTLQKTSVYSVEIRRWFRAIECLPQVLRIWTTLKVMFTLCGKQHSKKGTYWKMVLDLLESNEVHIHMKRVYALLRPLQHECSRIMALSSRGGPAMVIDRYHNITGAKTMHSLAALLSSKEAIESAGCICIEPTNQAWVYTDTGICVSEPGDGNVSLVDAHRVAVFTENAQPLVLGVCKLVGMRTVSTANVGQWSFTGLLHPRVKSATLCAKKVVDIWHAFISLEQNRVRTDFAKMYAGVGNLSQNIEWRNCCLRTEQWLLKSRYKARQNKSEQRTREEAASTTGRHSKILMRVCNLNGSVIL